MANSSLFPPIVAYSMPAFAIENSNNETRAAGNTSVRIYFALSSYNSRGNFSQVHATVRYQQNNSNALDLEQYPAQIKICTVGEVTPDDQTTPNAEAIAATPYRYYITLNSSDIDGGFQVDTTYKVQLRLSEVSGTNPKKLDWFIQNQKSFSEWSTVCLIRGIIAPQFFVLGLEDDEDSGDEDVERIHTSTDPDFTISYTPGSKEETLRKWQVQLLDELGNLVADSGEIGFDSYNNILYEDNGSVFFEVNLPYQMEPDAHYTLVVSIETKNGYTKTKRLSFIVTITNQDPLPATIEAYIIEEDGYAVVQLTGTEDKSTLNVTLSRTSSRSNFTIWEDIANMTVVDEKIDWAYCDFTIESGTYYRYGAQVRDVRGRRGLRIITDPVMGEFEDAFLVESGESLSNAKQLKLRYDFKINTFTRTVSESKTDTIGSQYPYVRRSGNMYYREIQCTGLITGFMDNSNLFTTKAKLYGSADNARRYAEIRDAIDMKVNQYDYTYEREFRNAVESFLQNSKIKLFKSLQEGNMFVKVMNVSYTPRQGVGRLLYDFTATFVEVDEVTIANLNKYGLIHIGHYNPNITWTDSNLLGRLVDANQISIAAQQTDSIPTLTIAANTNIMDLIKSKYNVGTATNGTLINDVYLTHLRLEMESEPYMIKNGTIPRPVDVETEQIDDPTKYTVGWLIQINDEIILLQPPNNIYELKGEDIYLSSQTIIKPLADTDMQIDFVSNLIKSQDTRKVATRKVYRKINGQYINNFKSDENIYRTLWYKYYIDFYSENSGSATSDQEDYYEQIITVFTLDIEAEPGAIIKARSSGFNPGQLSTMIVGETGRLFLDPGSTEFTIEEVYIAGMRVDARYLIPKNDIRDYDEALVKVYNDTTLKEFNDIHNKGAIKPVRPAQYDYVIIDDKAEMFYRGEWYPTEITQVNSRNAIFDIDCPVDAIVFYFIQAEKGYYG